jgi:16S rRNA (guanine527-N7)-methyltransferase
VINAVSPPIVSRETAARLDAFETEFLKWAARINLVAPSTINDVRQRHFDDSAQILAIAPATKTIIDLGSGGGFPGLVLAVLLAETDGAHVDLVESNGKKCAFLRHVVRTLTLPATIHCDRIEDVIAQLPAPDSVTARALAPLPLLLRLAYPQLSKGIPAFFHKGRDHAQEIAAARSEFTFDLITHQSRVETGSVILEIRNVATIAI